MDKNTKTYTPSSQSSGSESEHETKSNEVIKFQDLEEGKTYTATASKEVHSKYDKGKSYILEVNDNILVWSTPALNKYMADHKEETFKFTVKISNKGEWKGWKYAEIEGFNTANNGFIKFKK